MARLIGLPGEMADGKRSAMQCCMAARWCRCEAIRLITTVTADTRKKAEISKGYT